MAEYLAPECVKDNPNTSYDLIANICYEGQTGWILITHSFHTTSRDSVIDLSYNDVKRGCEMLLEI